VFYEHSIAIESPPQVRPQVPPVEPPTLELKVDVARAVDSTQWKRLLESDPDSTFFHTPQWGLTLEVSLEGWERFFVTVTAGDRLVAGLPAMKYSKRGFQAVMSMPFGTYGGPIVERNGPPSACDLLANRFFKEARSKTTAFAELVDSPQRPSNVQPNDIRHVIDETQVLDLDRSFDELMRGFRPNNRNTIRKAQKSGVLIRRGRRRDDFLRYRSILLDCSKNWGGRLRYNEKFFDVLSTVDDDSVQLWLAEYNRNVVAGLLNFIHNDRVMNWSAVMLRKSRPLAPMNLLHAEAIRDAVNRGYIDYNFGSSAGIKGVDWFKARFGTRRVKYHHHVLQKRWFSLIKRWSKRKRI
jgi:CelD/BcsL family acetyltransferase involved in cellulose biosynthesis